MGLRELCPLLLFFSEIVLISPIAKYFTIDITFSYFISDDMTFAVPSA